MKTQSIALGMAIAALAASAQAVTDADIDASFFPYRKGVPAVPGLTPGVVINKGNVARFKDVIDIATYNLLEKGQIEIPVEQTQSISLHPNYIAATKKYAGQVRLGAKPGTIEGYAAGRPFPVQPDKSDPRAGEKLAFNYKFSQIVGDSGRIYPFYWKYIDYTTGKVEHQLDFDFHFISFKHRTTQNPVGTSSPIPPTSIATSTSTWASSAGCAGSPRDRPPTPSSAPT